LYGNQQQRKRDRRDSNDASCDHAEKVAARLKVAEQAAPHRLGGRSIGGSALVNNECDQGQQQEAGNDDSRDLQKFNEGTPDGFR
jgi:hypothetical protein